MGEQANSTFGYPSLKEIGANRAWHEENCVGMEGGDHDIGDVDTTSLESSRDSANTVESSCSSDLVEDASSSTSYTSTSSSSASLQNGPLYELSELLVHLPMKRGLSKYYHGESQSFTSLACVKSLEDLAKKTPQRRKMKSCKSYGGGLDGHRSGTPPKAVISKKASRGSFLSSLSKRSSLVDGSRPSFAVQRIF